MFTGYIIPSAIGPNGGVYSNVGGVNFQGQATWEASYIVTFGALSALGTSKTVIAGPQSDYPYGVDWDFNFGRNSGGGVTIVHKKESAQVIQKFGLVLHVSVPGCKS